MPKGNEKMNIIEFVVEKIIEKNGIKSKRFINEMDEFLNEFLNEYTVIINQSSIRQTMITNPEFLTTNVNFSNLEELQKVITKHLFTKLYTNNIISESEYKELCKKEDL